MSSTAPAQEDPPYTLHVYTNLIQLPVLVMNESMEPMIGIDPLKFTVKLDKGRPFRPTRVRAEGDDPISLAILLDAGGDQNDLLNGFGEALAQLVPESLHPQDNVSIYSVDCTLVRFTTAVLAVPGELTHAIDAVLHDARLHHSGKKHPGCNSSLRLRNSLAAVMADMARLPGRRVLLAVTSGYDGGSSITWADDRVFAGQRSVAIFGLVAGSSVPRLRETNGFANDFTSLCASTGGAVLWARPDKTRQTLERLVALLRARYIVEFRRPADTHPGSTDVEIRIAHTRAIIRSGGTYVIVADPKFPETPDRDPRGPQTSQSPSEPPDQVAAPPSPKQH